MRHFFVLTNMELCRLILLSSEFKNIYTGKLSAFYSTRPLPTPHIPSTKPDYRLHQIYLYPNLSIRVYPIFPLPNVCILSAPSRFRLLNHKVLSISHSSLGQQLFDKYLAAFYPNWQDAKCRWMYINVFIRGEATIQKPGTCSPHQK